MTDVSMDTLISRIQKMHAKAESAKQLGNEAEAEAEGGEGCIGL